MLFAWLHLIIATFALAIPEEETYTIWGYPHGHEKEKLEANVKLSYHKSEPLYDQIVKSAQNIAAGDKTVEEFVIENMLLGEHLHRHIKRSELLEDWKRTLAGRSIPFSDYEMSLPPIDSMTFMYRTHPGDERFAGPIKILEIGSYKGGSAMWFSEFALDHPDSKLFCIDAWITDTGDVDEVTRAEFVSNVQSSKNPDKVYAIPTDSAYGLAVLTELKYEFDLILIDGSHLMLDVLHDALLAFELLKPGGTLVFDDYGCNPWSPAYGRTKEGIDGFVKVHRDSLQDIFYYPSSPVQVVSFTKTVPVPVPPPRPLDSLKVLLNSVAHRHSTTEAVAPPAALNILVIAENAEEIAHWAVEEAKNLGAPIGTLEVVNRVGKNTTLIHAGTFIRSHPNLAPAVLRLPPADISTSRYLAGRISQFTRALPLVDIVFLSASANVDARQAMHNMMAAMYLLRVGGYLVIDNAAQKDRYPPSIPEAEQAWYGYDTVLTSATGKLLDISADEAFGNCTTYRVFRYLHNRFRFPNSEFNDSLNGPISMNKQLVTDV